ncbi:MAG: ion channel, partial [Candidatus Pacearchaeota archaeon]|nr:ion channel [Candidatus Pacearchaeota archaeon]
YFVEQGKVVGDSQQMFTQFFDGLWWTVVTITTVGYGDKYPITKIGKIFAIFLMFVGVVVTSILSGTIASIFVDKKLKEGRGLQTISTKNHIVICGWNNNAENILEGIVKLSKTEIEVVLINELSPEEFQAINVKFPEIHLSFVRGDFTNENILTRGAIRGAKAAIILSDNSGQNTITNADERTILATLAIKSLRNEILTSAELVNPENRQHLIRAKVDEILVNGEFNGFLLSTSAVSVGIPLLVKEILSFESKFMIKQVPVPSTFIGKSFKEFLDYFYNAGKGIVIGVLSEEKKMTLDDLLSEGSDAIDEFIKKKFKEAEVNLLGEEKEEQKILLSPGEDYVIGETDIAFVIGR